MRGKKRDSEFLSNFIAECIANGVDSPNEIVTQAKQMIEKIDEQIKRVEKSRIQRSKLLDVIDAFQILEKPNRTNEILALSFLKIQSPKICKYICRTLSTKNSTMSDFFDDKEYSQSDIIFAIKQLLEHKVISKIGNLFTCGEKFEEYLQFILGSNNANNILKSQ